MSSVAVRTAEDGFTLVELLVAMALLGMLAAILVSGLHFGVRAWEATDRHLKDAERLRLVQALMRKDIEDAYPLLDLQNTAARALPFHGGETSLELLISNAEGQAQIGWSVTKKNNEQQLVRTVRRNFSGGPGAETKVLLSGFSQVTLSYYGAAHGGEKKEWAKSWNGASQPPDLVRVHMSFPDGDTRYWPEMDVSPLLTADVYCRYDTLTKYCAGR